ncbi:MAG TPA: glycerol-3-phosphate dehydrogenase/oxidase [Solirubrobacteraceae bacterium]|nr:glycerol-3-phosphate dehydrogenase/oxidase [Solirubrobacteraceae bacterium]
MKREDAIRSLATEAFDVAVIGGGITGVGVALDAASRGFSVALIEQADYAAGTSSRSSKLVHGGLRYLQNFDLGLVREALMERQLMVRLSPHLVRPLKIVIPAFGGARPDRITGIGLNMYDVMSASSLRGLRGRRATPAPEDAEWSPDRHRIISGEEVLELLPALSERDPTGGYLFYDCQTDDVRLVLTVLYEAERFGTVAANRVRALGLASGGVRCRDLESGEDFTLRAANVVNATGVWADRIRPGELASEAEVPQIRPSRGTHILLSRADLPLVSGAIVPAGENRTIFALPWYGMSLIGTTDNNYSGSLDHIVPDGGDIDYLLAAVNEFFARSLGPGDIQGAFAGVRPLISTGDSRKSVDISRKAELYETSSGMITITGGKLTTWRRMAKMAVDAIVERDGRYAPCRTERIPLGQPVDARRLTRISGVPEASYDHLAARYGHRAERVLALAVERRELAKPILRGHPDLLAEVAFAGAEEQARSVGDVLLRRTRLGLLAGRALTEPQATEPARVADVLASVLGWDRMRVATAIGEFTSEAAAEDIALAGVPA